MGARRRRRGRSRKAAQAWGLLLLVALALLVVAAAREGLLQWPPPDEGGTPAPPLAQGALEVHVVDVGQGDGTVWRLPGGGIVVYDCGPPASSADENPVVRRLEDALGVRPGDEVWMLVASHGHLDHVGGCDELLERYRFRHVVEAWYDGDDRPESYRRFQRLVMDEGATVHTARATDALDGEALFAPGDLLPLPDAATEAGVRAEVLWPPVVRDDWDRIAETSVAVRLVHGEVAFCMQGDVETAQEGELALRAPPDACEVYLVGHHGSRHASSAAWLERMDPEAAVVSFGDNPYGHPTAEAMCRLQQAGATVYATHRAGTLVVASDGRSATVSPGAAETRDYCADGADYWA